MAGSGNRFPCKPLFGGANGLTTGGHVGCGIGVPRSSWPDIIEGLFPDCQRRGAAGAHFKCVLLRKYGITLLLAPPGRSSPRCRTGIPRARFSEVKLALIKPYELRSDTRSDEAFVLVRGARPLRCGRALWFRRPEWTGLVQANRFHRDDRANRDAAE
jgi:hypothetical protein